jgi:hypothetical protein
LIHDIFKPQSELQARLRRAHIKFGYFSIDIFGPSFSPDSTLGALSIKAKWITFGKHS